ncbi:nicotinate-nucleotide adenylyltransferase [Aureibacillus halotolerans]|uniref:Probable nicotinate-nucleotide adenylyltransferase n=1 Tax=Aureibacillus halotolerans TaxID=1508390 RepID=A0A4R6TYT9_9BACI|nr:nicotinate-nucleotide adenylyltransferase [Aureibacillus halotolerans]TDQ38032.1 nicotinate-nucleotide adenylyltransferase [Aureibacillus halotolerans]
MNKKVGLLGGTFDPPHIGHLILAQEVLVACQLDEIWFVPAQDPPHKKTRSLTSGVHRCAMLEKAIQGNQRFRLCSIEFTEALSYTVDTVAALQNAYPDVHFSFIIGADMVEGLHLWKDIDDLMSQISFIAAKRPGYSLQSKFPLTIVDTPEIELSSTWLRNRLSELKPIAYLLDEDVLTYIKEHDLYVQP